jgi:hypothetical protein
MQGSISAVNSKPKGRKQPMIRNAFVVMMAVAGASAAATALVALGWWNVRGEQAPATALGISMVLMGCGMFGAVLGCRLYPRTEFERPSAIAASASAAGQGS